MAPFPRLRGRNWRRVRELRIMSGEESEAGGADVKLLLGTIAAALGLAAAAQEPSGGLMANLSGAGGDRALGETRYKERCASCHDNPTGRTPSKAAIADNTPTFIINTMFEGVMAPMARGLTPHEMGSIGVYLATRKPGAPGAVDEAPMCEAKAARISISGPQWNGWGLEPTQHRYQPDPGLAAADIPRLKVKWAFAFAGSRFGQATVVGERLYINSASGAVYALNAKTGCAYWRFDADGPTRSTIIVGRLPNGRHAAYFSDWTRKAYAIDAETGALIWKTRIDDQSEVQMTGSPVLHAGRVYFPVSSAEEAIATDDAYECCKFRGAVVAVDAVTGKVAWKTYMTPHPARPFRKNAKGVQMYGPAGGAIWSAPTIDAKRGVLYVATGDSYTDETFPAVDAVVALDLKTGAFRWIRQLAKSDNYIIGCYGQNRRANCPQEVGPDHDFGASPILHTLPGGKQLILAGQKSAELYALDPDAKGAVVWKQRPGFGGPLGGIEFSIAADRTTVYAPVVDLFTNQGKPGLYAFNIADGAPKWSARSPSQACRWKNTYCHPGLSQAVSVIPGAVFAAAMNGRFRAYDTATGKVIWEFDTAAQPYKALSGREATGGVMDGAGPTIVDGMVYVTTGYQGRSGVPGLVLLAFSVDGK
jgi:polyvinyl alcohol dehydrogenase (cytochrome)